MPEFVFDGSKRDFWKVWSRMLYPTDEAAAINCFASLEYQEQGN